MLHPVFNLGSFSSSRVHTDTTLRAALRTDGGRRGLFEPIVTDDPMLNNYTLSTTMLFSRTMNLSSRYPGGTYSDVIGRNAQTIRSLGSRLLFSWCCHLNS